ncbi:MAG: AAA family ATPase [Xenococcus sp. (in: cyanobacteria)]
MKIKTIEYEDKKNNWKLKPLNFSSNLTLLVGISGVGKTQILKAIDTLKKITNGDSFNGIKWKINFTDINGQDYTWQGEFETTAEDHPFIPDFLQEKDQDKIRIKILEEKLFIEERLIAEKRLNRITFEGHKTPKLSPYKSFINLLSEEEEISLVKQEFEKIILSDISMIGIEKFGFLHCHRLFFDLYDYDSLEDLQNENIDIDEKLVLAYHLNQEIFEQIKEDFLEIFPFVEDIEIESANKNKTLLNFRSSSFKETFLKDYHLIAIKERGIDSWIKYPNISAGMLKSLMHIAELYLLPEGSVVLIDEFENSLGINCIDSVTENLLFSDRLQYIITSHHPYIINNINSRNWKIVKRKGGIVETADASEIGIPKSKDEAFFELNNYLQEYDEEI